jgi:hypothetical protein
MNPNTPLYIPPKETRERLVNQLREGSEQMQILGVKMDELIAHINNQIALQRTSS